MPQSGLSTKETKKLLKDIWGRGITAGHMSDELAEMFMNIFGGGGLVSGGIGGADRRYSNGVMNEYGEATMFDSPFGNELLGPKNPLELKPGYGMGGQRPQDVKGDEVTFRRETDPYSMYRWPNDPTMWDEAVWDAKIGRGLKGWEEVSQAYHDLEQSDIREDEMDMMDQISNQDVRKRMMEMARKRHQREYMLEHWGRR